MATLDSPAPVNLVRSIFLCNVFHFFFSATKACLIPFLTVYFKLLGLSAAQTGFAIGLKTLVGLVFAPLWSKCSVRCGKRRCMLMFSLVIMCATYLSLTAVPSIQKDAFATNCALSDVNSTEMIEMIGAKTTAKQEDITTVKPLPTTATTLSEPTQIPPEGVTTKLKPVTVVNTKLVTASPSEKSSTKIKEVVTTTVAQTTSSTKTVTSNTKEPSSEDERIEKMLREILMATGIPEEKLAKLDGDELGDLINELLSSAAGQRLLNRAMSNLPPEDTDALMKYGRKKREAPDSDVTDDGNSKPSWAEVTLKKLRQFQDQIRESEDQMFIVVLVILVVGESLSCPIEKLADDGWFEFLESIDDMEKYGMQRIWSSFAYILVPTIITLIIDNSNCLFGLSVHPFMLHFYLFGGFLGLTFLLAYCYPMITSEKYRYANKVGKGIRVVCCNVRSLIFTITLLVMGIVYSSYYNFLFWLLIDMGSKEITLGLCITLAALAEIPMLLFNEKLISKIGNGGVVCLSLLFLSARCLYYSFLPTPWAVLPAEITHSFTHTAMWWAVLSSPSFNTSPALSRSIRSILSSVYFGLGFGVGSIISGIVYDNFGAAILFQAGAVIAIAWFPFLCLGVRCCREKDRNQVKYSRLLTSDDASDTSDSMEDDWLEQALKDK
ncbi:MFS_1 like [Mactra antiquata]